MRRLIFTVLFLLASIQVFAQNYSPYCNLDSALRVKRSAKRISLIVPADNLTISDADAIAFIGCANESILETNVNTTTNGQVSTNIGTNTSYIQRYGIWSSGTNPLQTNTDIFNFCQLVACQGESTPDQSGTFISFTNLVLNGPGDVAFIANVHKNSSKKPVPSLWVGSYENGSYVLTNVASVGDQAEGTSGVFTAFHNIALPDQARLIFLASFKSKNHKEDHKEKQGVWALNPDGSLSLLVAQGVPLPGSSEVINSFSLLKDSPPGITRSFNQLNGNLIFNAYSDRGFSIVYILSSTPTLTLANNGTLNITPFGTNTLILNGNGTIVNGGTITLGTNQISTNWGLVLQTGTVSLNPGSNPLSQTFSSLTLTGNSAIDFSNLGGSSYLTFGNIYLNGNTLNVYNWSATNARGIILNNTNLNSTELANINFYSGNSTNSVFLGSGSITDSMIIPETNNLNAP
jgi:hypothetical protein